MDKYNEKDKGNSGPGINWKKNVGVTGDYKRGLKPGFAGNVESENRPGPGQKGK